MSKDQTMLQIMTPNGSLDAWYSMSNHYLTRVAPKTSTVGPQ